MVRQFALNNDLNLFYLRLSEAVRVDGDFVCELLNLKKAGIPDLEDLKDIYRETFYDLDDSNGTKIIIAHHERLSRWLSVFYPPSFIETLRGQKKNRPCR